MLVHVIFAKQSSFQQQSKLLEHKHFFQEIDEQDSKDQHVSFDATSNLSNIKHLQVDMVQAYKLAHSIEKHHYI